MLTQAQDVFNANTTENLFKIAKYWKTDFDM